MTKSYTRREMLRISGRAAILAGLVPQICRGEKTPAISTGKVVAGDETVAQAGRKVLADGGNAIDAAVAAALTACVVTPVSCGAGGYGGHMTIGLAGEKKITSIDFNTVAPAAAKPDMYKTNSQGYALNGVNSVGWLAVSVPGTLAGIQLAANRYGTRPLGELMAPAIALAREGFPFSRAMAAAVKTAAVVLRQDPGTLKTLFKADGTPYRAGELYRNPELAAMLEALARKNSVDAFYRGDIAQRLAEEIQKKGGLVTAQDLANYSAHEVAPLEQEWNGFMIYTAPLTAGGLTVLEGINILKAMGWSREKAGTARSHGRLEVMRTVWRDRLEFLGDPAKVEVPVKRLLDWDYALEAAKVVEKAVHEQKALELHPGKVAENGTMNISAVDGHGNMAVITLTHGNAFGAEVTVESLGLMMGQGMSRFEAAPGKPNSIAPGKRPLDNMCPTIVTRHGKPTLAVGGAGGRHIPNTISDILWSYAGLHETMEEAMNRPRLSTTGDMNIMVEATWPADELSFFKSLGYEIGQLKPGVAPCHAGAVTFDAATGECAGVQR